MIRAIAAAAGAALLLAGCMSTKVSMFPVEGPLSRMAPLPTIQATAKGIESNTGEITMVRPGDDLCSGRWSSVAPQMVVASSGSLFSTYGSSVGFNSVSVANMPGTNRGEAFLACSSGATVQAEFYTGSGTANGYGVAKDSDGNVYKMLF
ncbi:hypothetical protein [Devosia sp. CAU 1758]